MTNHREFNQGRHSDKHQPMKLSRNTVCFSLRVLFGLSEVLTRNKRESVRCRPSHVYQLSFTITRAGPDAVWAPSKWKARRLERVLWKQSEIGRVWNEGGCNRSTEEPENDLSICRRYKYRWNVLIELWYWYYYWSQREVEEERGEKNEFDIDC